MSNNNNNIIVVPNTREENYKTPAKAQICLLFQNVNDGNVCRRALLKHKTLLRQLMSDS
jgi:hypothetical protein